MAMTDKTTKFRVEVGERLKRLRETKGMVQGDVGEIIGMVAGGISMIEKGQRGLDPEDAVRLKKATGVSLDWLYAGEAGSLPKDLFKPLTAKPLQVPANSQAPKRAAKA